MKERPFSRIHADDLDADFINRDHIEAFAEALAYDEYNDTVSEGNSLRASISAGGFLGSMGARTTGSSTPGYSTPIMRPSSRKGSSVELISSQNDWSPIYPTAPPSKLLKQKLKLSSSSSKLSDSTTKGTHNNNTPSDSRNHSVKNKSKKKETKNIFQNGWTFTLVRYPILFFILIWLLFLSIVYLIIRLYVAFFESYFAWSGERAKLREKMRHSKNYSEWIDNAEKLDKYLGFDKWREEDSFFCYDYRTLRRLNKKLKFLRECENSEELMVALQGCIKSNFAGTENPLLYSQCYYGTKKLVENYNNEVVESLNYIINENKIPLEEKRLFFKIVSRNFGKTALCLSGGASFAYTHYGIIKAMLDNDLMPKIISGTSGGGLVASLACTRTKEELKNLLNPSLSRKMTACSDPMSVWLKRWWRTGARFDAVDWAEKCSWWTIGSLTFKEAYERTGKILNISTVPNDPHSPVILCNHITSPNCVIWSALLASAAVPGILNPVVLMMKNKDGSISPFSFGNRWKDGSMRTDIPVEALNTYYNAKFSIVSQVNPHIALFFYAPKGSVGRPVARRKGSVGFRGGFIGAALENLVKLEITKWLKLIKEFDLLPSFKDSDWSNVFLQRFSGTITLWPKIKLTDFYYILSDPTEERLKDMIFNGEICAYPKLLFIKHRLNIERAIEKGRKVVKNQLNKKFSTDMPSSGNSSKFNTSGINSLVAESTRNFLSENSDSDFAKANFDISNIANSPELYEDDDEYNSGFTTEKLDGYDHDEDASINTDSDDDDDDEDDEYDEYSEANLARNLYLDDTGLYNTEDYLHQNEGANSNTDSEVDYEADDDEEDNNNGNDHNEDDENTSGKDYLRTNAKNWDGKVKKRF